LSKDQKNGIETEIEQLRQALPDPFELPSKIDDFFTHPTSQKLFAGGDETIRWLISFLKQSREPAMVRVAVLLLSRFSPAAFYDELLAILSEADRLTAEAFELGIWLVQLPKTQIAHDLVRVAASSDNPHPLLLLQRGVAKDVRAQLREFILLHKLPFSLYALYSYRYALEQEDIPLLKVVSEWADVPQLSALAGLYLLRLGSIDGLEGIRAGLISSDEELRTMTYYELGDYLPKPAIAQAGYNPSKPGDSQRAAVDILIEHVTLTKSIHKQICT
jgi:hypothetical protein